MNIALFQYFKPINIQDCLPHPNLKQLNEQAIDAVMIRAANEEITEVLKSSKLSPNESSTSASGTSGGSYTKITPVNSGPALENMPLKMG